MKRIDWVGSCREDLHAFPIAARREAGYQLDKVQHGEEPSDWKPMTTIGPGVREIRIHVGGAFRVLYVANIGTTVYVLHAFRKKTRRTALQDLHLARQRLQSLKR